jgi:hypothetical protein
LGYDMLKMCLLIVHWIMRNTVVDCLGSPQ